MNRSPEMLINRFQLALLLNNAQKHFYNEVLANNVFCSHCGEIAKKGIVVEEIYLTRLNDIMVRGTCKVCNGKVARIIEFGEDKNFCEKANNFRNSKRG